MLTGGYCSCKRQLWSRQTDRHKQAAVSALKTSSIMLAFTLLSRLGRKKKAEMPALFIFQEVRMVFLLHWQIKRTGWSNLSITNSYVISSFSNKNTTWKAAAERAEKITVLKHHDKKKNTDTARPVLTSWNIYFKNWKNKNKPTNIVLVYHTKTYFNVAMWVFVSLWLQCEAVWKAGWAGRTTDTDPRETRDKETEGLIIKNIWAKIQPNITQGALNSSFKTLEIAQNVDLSFFNSHFWNPNPIHNENQVPCCLDLAVLQIMLTVWSKALINKTLFFSVICFS